MRLLDTLNDLMRPLGNFSEASEAKDSLEKVPISCMLSTFCLDFLGKKLGKTWATGAKGVADTPLERG